MTPVAWYIENNYYDSLEEAQAFCDNKAQISEHVTPLYTDYQLRRAKVEAIYAALCFCVNEADRQRMSNFADEIERGKM